MTDPNALNPHPAEFERFLYASVGEDRNGSVVTVLSTLARLELDPWQEAADLVALGRDAARSRLETLLARFRDVPALASDHERIARDLSELLPGPSSAQTLRRTASTGSDGRPATNAAFWVALGIIFLLFQIFMVGGSGAGE